MEITRELKVPAPYLFNQIIDSVRYDVLNHTGKSVSISDLDKQEYVKEFNGKNRAMVKIIDVVENSLYAYEISTSRNRIEVRYEIEKIDNGRCELRYKEKSQYVNRLDKMNDLLFKSVLGYFRKKRFTQMLSSIEATY